MGEQICGRMSTLLGRSVHPHDLLLKSDLLLEKVGSDHVQTVTKWTIVKAHNVRIVLLSE